MRVALKDKPIASNDPPAGMVQVTLNGATEWIKAEDMDHIQEFDQGLQEKTDDAAFDIF
jgi:penicillin-binding protein 1A